MDFSSEHRAGALVAHVSGEVDHANAADLERQLLPLLTGLAPGTRVVLDLSGVEFMSSLGLRVLMLAAKQSRAASLQVCVAGLRPTLREIFQISRFDKVFPLSPDVDAALAAAAGS